MLYCLVLPSVQFSNNQGFSVALYNLFSALKLMKDDTIFSCMKSLQRPSSFQDSVLIAKDAIFGDEISNEFGAFLCPAFQFLQYFISQSCHVNQCSIFACNYSFRFILRTPCYFPGFILCPQENLVLS
jgi:hypothetical protein